MLKQYHTASTEQHPTYPRETRETPEARGLAKQHMRSLLNAISLDEAISSARRATPDGAGKYRRIGRNVGAMTRQMYFWDEKGNASDNWLLTLRTSLR